MMEYATLNNGLKMPMAGIGTFLLSPDEAEASVLAALEDGYRLIDTANAYVNEKAVGRAMKKSGLKREEIFLETKLWPSFYEDEDAVDKTLERLGTDYIDLMILHHPVNNYLHAYGMLEKACKAGKLRAIGLSNFPVEKLQKVLGNCEIPPMVMQVEAHPYYPAEGVRSFCEEHRIQLQCWYPLGHGSSQLLQDPVILEIAQVHGKSPAQVVLRWHIQMGFCPVPGSKSHAHIQENGEIFDFALTPEDMVRIAGINRHTPFYQVTPESLQRLATTKCNFEE